MSVKVGVEPRINLQLTNKISLELDSNSCLLLEYNLIDSLVRVQG